MGRMIATVLTAAGVLMAPVMADAAACPPGLICASNPQGVVSALQTIGYKAKLSKDDDGDPRINSSANGYDFDIAFYGCTKGLDCRSLGFVITFEKDSVNSAELANLWNKENRFSAMSYDPADGTLSITYDVTTEGGLNKENFADVVDWWDTMLGLADKFFTAHPAKEHATT